MGQRACLCLGDDEDDRVKTVPSGSSPSSKSQKNKKRTKMVKHANSVGSTTGRERSTSTGMGRQRSASEAAAGRGKSRENFDALSEWDQTFQSNQFGQFGEQPCAIQALSGSVGVSGANQRNPSMVVNQQQQPFLQGHPSGRGMSMSFVNGSGTLVQGMSVCSSQSAGKNAVSASTITRMRTLRRRDTEMVGGQGTRFKDEYKIEQHLAAGAYGMCFLATEVHSGRRVVVKRPNDAFDTSDFERLVNKTSPYIVRMFEIFSDGVETYMVMEYCAGGNLFSAIWALVEKQGGVDYVWCAKVFKQVLQGLHYLQQQFGESHNDIKPENILLEHTPKGSWDAPRTMIADFGLASGPFERAKHGDPRYLAPEIEATRFSQPHVQYPVVLGAADVWSCGITLYELLTGLLPFTNHHNISGWQAFRAYQNGELERRLREAHRQMMVGQLHECDCRLIADQKAQNLVRRCLQVDPTNRIQVAEALRHPWLEQCTQVENGKKESKSSSDKLDIKVCRAHALKAMDLKLREVLLMLVTSKLQGAHVAFYEKVWNKWDFNNDGILDRAEFAKLYADLNNPHGSLPPNPMEIFKAIDVDASGTIDFNEFVAFMFDPKRLPADIRRMYFLSAFNNLKGPDGCVRLADFEKLFSNDVQYLVVRLFHEMDPQGTGNITFEKFQTYIMLLCEP